MSLRLVNKVPCTGLVRVSAIMSLAGQQIRVISPRVIRSFSQKVPDVDVPRLLRTWSSSLDELDRRLVVLIHRDWTLRSALRLNECLRPESLLHTLGWSYQL